MTLWVLVISESDDTDIYNYDDIEAIWRLPVKKEEYTANFSSIDTYNISGDVRLAIFFFSLFYRK